MLSLRQLTSGKYGHMLNRRQSISPDRKWIVYDTRNEDSQIARTNAIELVSVVSGEMIRLYETAHPTIYGPGVGAVSFHPNLNQIVFIHGLECCSDAFPYSAARRFGAILEVKPNSPDTLNWTHAEPRVVQQDHPSIDSLGVLSGGTHAHSWNESNWISFTYNDERLESQSQSDPTIRDARTVGFMVPALNPKSDYEPNTSFGNVDTQNFNGAYYAFLAATIHASTSPGSDEIDQAVEECWVGQSGYRKSDGSQQSIALAFQGKVTSESGQELHEVFVCDLPDQSSLLLARDGDDVRNSIRRSNRLSPVPGCSQRRLTYTAERTYPGIQGPRNWLVSSPAGDSLFFPMKDERAVVQLFRVSTTGGNLQQISELPKSIEGQISLNQDGTQCAFLCDQRIVCIDLATGSSHFVTERNHVELVGSVQYLSHDRLICNAYVGTGNERYLHIFIAE